MRENANARREIGALYGFRVLMTLLVANFHIWQQSWLPQTVTLLGSRISFDYITRTGYFFVDGLILLSGFLLFCPMPDAVGRGRSHQACWLSIGTGSGVFCPPICWRCWPHISSLPCLRGAMPATERGGWICGAI